MSEEGDSGYLRAFEDVRLLFNYIVREKDPLAPSLLHAFVALNQKISARQLLDSADEESLWGVLDQLSALAYPVSAASLRTAATLDADNRPLFLRFGKRASPPQIAIKWAVRWVITSLLLVMITQIYALVGTTLFRDIDRLEGERRTVLERIDDLRAAKTPSDDSRLQGILARYDELDDRIKRNRAVVVDWNQGWLILTRMSVSPATPPAEAEGDKVGDLEPQQRVNVLRADHQGRIALQAISLFVLPMLYGLLGACAFILRSLTQQIDSATLSHVSLLQLRMRQALGLVLGAIVGLFYTDTGGTAAQSNAGANAGALSLSLVALAFAAGYSVELTFTIIDGQIERWSTSLRQALRPSHSPNQTAAKPAGPTSSSPPPSPAAASPAPAGA